MDIEQVGKEIIDSSMKVHTALGPGLLEGASNACLAYELQKRGLRVRTEVPLPVIYDGFKVDLGYRIDLLVEESVIVELKAVSKIKEIHDAQLLSYLVLSGHKLGFRINFHEVHLKHGIRRMVNGL